MNLGRLKLSLKQRTTVLTSSRPTRKRKSASSPKNFIRQSHVCYHLLDNSSEDTQTDWEKVKNMTEAVIDEAAASERPTHR